MPKVSYHFEKYRTQNGDFDQLPETQDHEKDHQACGTDFDRLCLNQEYIDQFPENHNYLGNIAQKSEKDIEIYLWSEKVKMLPSIAISVYI